MEETIVTSTKEMTSKHNKRKDPDSLDEGDYLRNTIHHHDPGENQFDCDSSDSLETSSDEIPVWIHGEQRWISGVNDETTCSDLVNVLLADEAIEIDDDDNGERSSSISLTGNGAGKPSLSSSPVSTKVFSKSQTTNKKYVITERWRRVEQILPDNTKILEIWNAWGHAKSEVKLTFRQIDSSIVDWSNNNNNNSALSTFDKDSGMGCSPNGSTISAIIRRRRHRASKSSTAWMTQAQTIHPKSQKATIEKLMKLILEQGETIQQQLIKLRDRELQIAKIEEERHKIREKEHGKNYLLETYLNGLHQAEEKDVVAVHSDSGVQTEGALSSPEVGSSYIQEDEDYHQVKSELKKYIPPPTRISSSTSLMYKGKPSHREKKLLKEHKHTKLFSSRLSQESSLETSETTKLQLPLNKSSNVVVTETESNDIEDDITKELEVDLSEKIEWMEKLVVINKHLQREEELLVRLSAKLRQYEVVNPLLDEKELREALTKVNDTIDKTTNDIQLIQDDLIASNEQLCEKMTILENLTREFAEIDQMQSIISTASSTTTAITSSESSSITTVATMIPLASSETIDIPSNGINLKENLNNYKEYISKPNYEFNEINENRDQKSTIYHRHTPDLLKSSQFTKTAILPKCTTYSSQQANIIYYPGNQMAMSLNQKFTQIPNLKCNSNKKNEYDLNMTSSSSSSSVNQIDLVTSMNLLQKSSEQLPLNGMNIYPSNCMMSNSKLIPKKFLTNNGLNGVESESTNSDTGISSISEDITQLGTLV